MAARCNGTHPMGEAAIRVFMRTGYRAERRRALDVG